VQQLKKDHKASPSPDWLLLGALLLIGAILALIAWRGGRSSSSDHVIGLLALGLAGFAIVFAVVQRSDSK
jgi:hypothetical protein